MTNHTDRVVIVGAGIAALYAALTLAPRPVLVISPEPLGFGASSAWAQGGVAAAIGQGDAPALHLADTIRAGAGLVDAAVAGVVTTEAPELIAALAALGAPFDRDALGGYVLSREAAHGLPRVVRVGGDRAGAAIMATLMAAVEKADHIQVMTGLLATGVLTEQGRAVGVTVEGAAGQGSIHAPAIILAGGGAAGLYAVTTNPNRIRGQMLGMAARAGAVIRDAEFIQFHPTAIDTGEDPAPLATEALRGEGAVLLNNLGQRFMLDVASEAELAPRDIVARAVYVETQTQRRPVLDTRQAIGRDLPAHFPTVHTACLRAGIDPVAEPIPVTAAAHYHMGGIAVDGQGRSSLPGLWVCGEAACTGLHGANRLASNGLLEALVFGRRVGRAVGATVTTQGDAPAQITLSGQTMAPDEADIAQLRRLMTDHVGVVRDAKGLTHALSALAALDRPDQPLAMQNMLVAATVITSAALIRRESRGAHCRSDFAQTLPKGEPSHLTWLQAQMIRADAVMER
jgi:L-aspartate oxidase